MEYLPACEQALKEVVGNLEQIVDEEKTFHVGFEGSFGEFHTNPRKLGSHLLSKLVCVDGIATSCSLVRPKLLKSVHYCEARDNFVEREYRDATMNTNLLPTSTAYPREDADGNKLSTEFGKCKFQDHQTISIQEMPEKAPAGQLPRSIDIVVDDDLVDRIKPGDRVQVVGVYRSMAYISNGQVPSSFRTLLVANNIRLLAQKVEQQEVASTDFQNIRKIAKRKDVFELMSRSLAPSIYGHPYIKKAILLMLLGGKEMNLENGTHIRGDINIMMVGDPSTAKSQLLRFVLNIAPLAVATTGRGSSGVGLTAAVVTDKETGERRLEAGAMVLADRGVVCIDEFDKMNDLDRVAIHEVMEQQTVTIAKAGIHVSLNARCSVIAAANPIWGQYRETASPQENIRLPDSLLSRFDLLFIVLDVANQQVDRAISNHVLGMHRFIPPGYEEGAPIVDKETEREEQVGEIPVFEKYLRQSDDQEYLSVQFIRKFVSVAKTKTKPVLTNAACDLIVSTYTEFRQQKEMGEIREAKTYPVTPRTLETLIRLATAHAKLRFSNKVEKKDARVARELVMFCLYKEVKQKAKKARITDSSSESDSDSDSKDAIDAMKDLDIESSKDTKKAKDEFEFENLEFRPKSIAAEKKTSSTSSIQSAQSENVPVSNEYRDTIKRLLSVTRNQNPDSSFITFESFLQSVEKELDAADQAKIEQVLRDMEKENQLMFREGLIIFF